jgi:hypothetical protein
MKKMKRILTVLLILITTGVAANAAIIASFSSQGQSWGSGITVVSPTMADSHVADGTALSAVGVTGNTGANCFNTRGWSNTEDNFSKYFYIKINVADGWGYTFDAFQTAFRASATGPATIDVLAYIDGSATGIVLQNNFDIPNDGTTYSNVNWDFSALNLTFEKSLEIRVYGDNASSGSGTLRMNDYYPGNIATQVRGTAYLVPEPATMLLLGLGGLLLTRKRN